jgi:hypothetical protein
MKLFVGHAKVRTIGIQTGQPLGMDVLPGSSST